MPLSKKLYCLLFFLFITFTQNMQAQLLPGTSDTTQQAAEIPEDSLGRRNPRGTVNGFFEAVAAQNYIRASQFLALKRAYRRESERERVVKAMQRLLDRGGNIVPYSLISNKNEGRTDDDLPAGVDLVGTVTTTDKNTIELLLENTAADNQPPLWQFSTETVNALAAVTPEDALLVDKVLPEVLKTSLLGGVPVGHWLALLVIVVISYLLSWAIVALITFLINKLWAKSRVEPTSLVISALTLPVKLYLALWLFVNFSQNVGISIIIRQRFSSISVTVAIIAFLILLWRVTDFISSYSKDSMNRRGRISAISVILFLRRTFKVAIIVFGIIAILGAVGVDVTAGLAALGIGGLALALGAQKTIENFVGSVTLIADQPIRVGDFCKVGDVTGTVEQIGMRSTKLRTGERTVVTIPNGELSANNIENYAHRDRFLFNPTLEVRYETTPDQLRYLLVELRSLLYAHPMVNPDPARVRFTGFGASALKLEVWSYINAPSFDVFLEAKEDLLLRMMDIISASGTDFAFQSQTLYFAKDKGMDEGKTAAAAEKVKQWKESNDLQLPAFDTHKIQELKNSIPYPDEGSVAHKKEAE